LLGCIEHDFEQAFATTLVQCAPNFYGLQCKPCLLLSPRHTCEHMTGKATCLKGWTGKNCEIERKK